MRIFGADFERDLSRIQALRSDPPGEVRTQKHRQRVFAAALEQFDGLARASGSVAPSISPILLFYALAQANQAVAASRVAGNHWRPTGHGLSITAPSSVLGEVLVTPDENRQSSFALFCTAIESPPLTGPVSLGELWAAVGMLSRVTGLGGEHDPALCFDQRGDDRAYISGALASELGATNAAAELVLAERLGKRYPTAAAAIRVEEFGSNGGDEDRVLVSWSDGSGGRRKVQEVFPPFLGDGGSARVPPRLSSGDVIDPLAAWWAVLLGLSSVARYRPDLWRASLDRDKTPVAVAVEDGIAHTRELLPIVVLWALTGQGWNR